MRHIERQRGISLFGLIFILAILGCIAILGLKIVPTVSEYSSIKRAIETAKAAGTTPAEIRLSFERQKSASYIESISGKDLEITKSGNEVEISFAYDKKIPLVGPASLLIEYRGSTARNGGTGKSGE
ncbi:MAG: DUF4845 domain-containing protein [Burkholderiales bacterium]|nr:DUF4845 domain-containing protein [Burkholderiales bacterium]